jgi:crotonobetainyl-CoA:carnitine CoA-transferase CaiB-like acyl-CoA transferase
VRDLVATADVVHHNMTNGVAERLGIDYASLVAVKPDLIYCNTYMYGPVGPLADFGGVDPLAQAAAGLEYGAGPVHEGNPPLWYRFGHGDTANGLVSVVGVLVALAHRDRTGEGQELWTSLLHGTAYMSSGAYVAEDGPAELPQLDREQTGHGPLYRLYPTIDGWLQVAAPKPEHWERLCTAVGRPELATDDRFATPEHRRKQRSELEDELATIFRTRTSLVWRRTLDDAGVPCEIPVDTVDGESVLFDQELVDLGLIAVYDHPDYGTLRQASQFVTFSETPGRSQGPMAKPGEHTVEVLQSIGYDDDRIATLLANGVIATS